MPVAPILHESCTHGKALETRLPQSGQRSSDWTGLVGTDESCEYNASRLALAAPTIGGSAVWREGRLHEGRTLGSVLIGEEVASLRQERTHARGV